MVQICILIIIICMCFDFNSVFLIFPILHILPWYHKPSDIIRYFGHMENQFWPLRLEFNDPFLKWSAYYVCRGSHRGNWMWDDGERLPRGVCQVSDGTRDLRSHSDPSQPGTCSKQVLWVHMRFHSQVKKNC